MGDAEAALEVAEDALRARPDWAPLAVAAEEAAATLGDWTKVERWARRALELPPPDSLHVTLNPTRDRVLPAVRLAQVLLQRGADGEIDAVLAAAARDIRNGEPVEVTRRAVSAALAAGRRGDADQALRVLAARYDEQLQSVVRSLRIQAERPLVAEAGTSAHA
jgi:hypothetical protein